MSPRNPDQAQSGAAVRRLPLASLARLSNAMAQALLESGQAPAKVEEIIRGSVATECVACGMAVSGADLLSLAAASDGPEAVDRGGRADKLDRVRLGDCARKGCTSGFCQVQLAPHSGVDWAPVWEAVLTRLSGAGGGPAKSGAGLSTAQVVVGAARSMALTRRQWLGLGGAGVVIVGLMLRAGYRVPLLSPKGRVFVVPQDPPGRPVGR